MAWATADEVARITGLPLTGDGLVTNAEVLVAQGVIELRSGVFADNAGTPIGKRDLELLRRAVAYQVSWLRAHPDAFERMAVTSTSSEGQSAAFEEAGVWLAPLAKAAVKRLSWKRSRTVQMTAHSRRVRPLYDDEGDIAQAFWKHLS